MTRLIRFGVALAAATALAACGNGSKGGGDMGGGDMAVACVTNPTTSVELLNACTTAQTGDPAKDAPYYPSLAPGGKLPPLP